MQCKLCGRAMDPAPALGERGQFCSDCWADFDAMIQAAEERDREWNEEHDEEGDDDGDEE